MKNVATLVLIFILSVNFQSCNGQSASANKKNAETVKENKVKTIKLTKADFLKKVMDYETNRDEWKYIGDKPAIIDFYADWCGPCRTIAPIMEELAEEYKGKIYIYKIDIDKERELAALFGIRSIPSLLFIPMKEDPQIAQGALTKAAYKKAIEDILLN